MLVATVTASPPQAGDGDHGDFLLMLPQRLGLVRDPLHVEQVETPSTFHGSDGTETAQLALA